MYFDPLDTKENLVILCILRFKQYYSENTVCQIDKGSMVWVCTHTELRTLENNVSTVLIEGTRELPRPFCQARTQLKDGRLWTRKWILTRHQIHGCLDLGSPSSRTERKISVVYKPPRLWFSVIAAQMDYTDILLYTLIFFFFQWACIIFVFRKVYTLKVGKRIRRENRPSLCGLPRQQPAATWSRENRGRTGFGPPHLLGQHQLHLSAHLIFWVLRLLLFWHLILQLRAGGKLHEGHGRAGSGHSCCKKLWLWNGVTFRTQRRWKLYEGSVLPSRRGRWAHILSWATCGWITAWWDVQKSLGC